MRVFPKLTLALGCVVTVASVAGVAASWRYAESDLQNAATQSGVNVNTFIYTPEEMPDEEVSVVQRLSDILNKRYTTDTVENSLEYLLEETIQVYWNNDKTQDPFVGSMDKTYADEIAELFGDVLEDSSVSFILKNQDLNGDGYKEVALYSTSDTLDNTSTSYDGVVCVYVTVFTPIVDSSGNVTGYALVCESLRGYCYEIYYSWQDRVPSFSTDTWLDSVGYTSWYTNHELPEDAQLDYDSYNKTYNGYTTKPMGDSLSTLLADKL